MRALPEFSEPITVVDVERVMRDADPVRHLDDVIDRAEHGMAIGLAGMIFGVVIALAAVWALAVLLLSFNRLAP